MNIVTVRPNLIEVTKSDGTIVVFSYNTPVIVRTHGSRPNAWRVTTQKYSATTSRHIKYYLTEVYAMRPGDWTNVSQDEINELAQ